MHALRAESDQAADSFEAAYALAPFPPAYTAEFVQALARASRRQRALEALNAESSKYPGSQELRNARREFAAGVP